MWALLVRKLSHEQWLRNPVSLHLVVLPFLKVSEPSTLPSASGREMTEEWECRCWWARPSQGSLLSLKSHWPKLSPMVAPNWKKSEEIWWTANQALPHGLYLLLLLLKIIIITHHRDLVCCPTLCWDFCTLALLFSTTLVSRGGHLCL